MKVQEQVDYNNRTGLENFCKNVKGVEFVINRSNLRFITLHFGLRLQNFEKATEN